MRIFITIGKVDEYGYCGREDHPNASHNGREAEVISMEHEDVSDDDDPHASLLVFTASIDGASFEFVEHEVVSIRMENR